MSDNSDQPSHKRISLLFSGGVDSTMAACKLAETFEQVDLISFDNGYGHYRIDRTAKRAEELYGRYPGVFRHSIISVRKLFEEMVINDIFELYRQYGSGFIWCMGCKLSMHIRTILYNVQHGIYLTADGSSFATSEMVEQMPASVARVKGFYCEYGITFENPVYEIRREESIAELQKRGFRMGFKVGDRFLGVQPKCKAGELYYMPLLLRGTEPDHQQDRVIAFIDEKLDWARKHIADHFDRHGLSLDRKNRAGESR